MGQENANDQPPPPPPTVWQKLAERVRNTPGSGLAFAVIPLLILGYVGWYYYGADHLDRTLYSLQLDNIELSPQPDWIRGDLKSKVYHTNQLSKVSLLDPQATATIAHAFEAHMWVKCTNHVRKQSGGKVVVDVTYRRPAAMVFSDEIPTPSGKGGAYPVDDDGVVLDTEEFEPSKVNSYFMIIAYHAKPAGKIGMDFGDPRITEALALCKLLESLRGPLKLDCIYVEPETLDLQLGGFNSWTLYLETNDHRKIAWGHTPGKETADEMRVDEKIAALTAWLKTSPSQSPLKMLDLRQRRGLGQRLTSTPNFTAPSVSLPASSTPSTRPSLPGAVPQPLPPGNLPPANSPVGKASNLPSTGMTQLPSGATANDPAAASRDATLRELVPQPTTNPNFPKLP